MSDIASQFTDPLLPTVLAEADSVDGVPFGEKLTREKLKRIRKALEEFERAIYGVSHVQTPRGKVSATNGQGAKKVAAKESHCIVVAGALGFRNTDRTKSTEEDVLNCCYRHFDGYFEEPKDVTLHVILDSVGGSLDTAFKTALLLRRFAGDIRVYVPRRAKSAATLITLGANEILMSPYAELGPLDTQIKDPRNPTKTISALDCYQSVDYVQKFALDAFPKALGVLVRETEARIPLSDLVDTATQFTLSEVTPILSQVKALDFGGWGRTLKIGEMYAIALQLRVVGDDSYEQKAAKIASKLVYGFPHHPYPIDRLEAKKIGLNASLMSKRAYESALGIARECDEGRCVGFMDDIKRMEEKLPLETISLDGHQHTEQYAQDRPIGMNPGKGKSAASQGN